MTRLVSWAALAALGLAGAASAQEILIPAEDVPAGLDRDGPSAAARRASRAWSRGSSR